MSGNSVVLIGMPGAGKSTIGILLAKALAKNFVDTDVLIQVREGKALQSILDESGYLELRRIEESVLLESNLPNCVIATGGSVVYSAPVMAYLQSLGPVVFLDLTVESLLRRIDNYSTRGIARAPDQSFESLYRERYPLYCRYADVTIDANRGSEAQLLQTIMDRLANI